MDIRCATSSYVYSHTSNTRYIANLSFINPQPLFLSHHTRSTSPEVFVSRVNSSRYISLFVITRQALIHIRYRSFFKPTATSHKRKQDKEQVEGKDKEHEKPAVKRKKGFVEEEEGIATSLFAWLLHPYPSSSPFRSLRHLPSYWSY